MSDVPWMIEAIAVRQDIGPNSRHDRVDRMPVARHGLIEAGGETGRRVLRRNAAGATSRLHEIIRGDRGEDAADDDIAVSLDLGENVGRRQRCDDVGEISHEEESRSEAGRALSAFW